MRKKRTSGEGKRERNEGGGSAREHRFVRSGMMNQISKERNRMRKKIEKEGGGGKS